MPRALHAPDGSKKLAVRAKPPGVPLVQPIEATNLMLATLRRAPFSLEGWIFEWKYDGFRCLIRKQDGAVDLVSRPGKSLNRSFPEIVAAVAQIPGDFTWDAELTVDTPTGHSHFEKLLSRATTSIVSRVRAGKASQTNESGAVIVQSGIDRLAASWWCRPSLKRDADDQETADAAPSRTPA
jgi:ATP-dependent DNA ligase